MTKFVDVVFEGNSVPDFRQVEDDHGRSFPLGTWLKRDDGFWVLRLPFSDPITISDSTASVVQVAQATEAEHLEMFAAAYLQKTKLAPTKCRLVRKLTEDGRGIQWYFEPLEVTEPEHMAEDGTVRKAHYGSGRQPWDVIKDAGRGPDFAAGNALKYVRRHTDKNGLDDIKKGRWYYDRLYDGAAEEINGPWTAALAWLEDQLSAVEMATLRLPNGDS